MGGILLIYKKYKMLKKQKKSIDELMTIGSSVITQNLDAIKGGDVAAGCHIWIQGGYWWDDCKGGKQEKYEGEMSNPNL